MHSPVDRLLVAFREPCEWLTIRQIAERAGVRYGLAQQGLWRLAHRGDVVRRGSAGAGRGMPLVEYQRARGRWLGATE